MDTLSSRVQSFMEVVMSFSLHRVVLPFVVAGAGVCAVAAPLAANAGEIVVARAAPGVVVEPALREVVVVAPSAPPPVRYEVVPEARAGYVWDRGHWRWEHGRYVWIAGHWEVERVGMHWAPGHWSQRGPGWVWVRGHWA
ncbi:YXWGXW repeat-containing protein [Burkholderia thailandensis]|uniref:YXWGXW repeat-containing protein n=1 Tax=Burkholderia thailandensis TaxID=57975 RepID=UPI00031119C3|nr:YXWGXW repeat-containing protein [Burkholderia thailandensis]AIP62691.2 YXWGXW repeat family protein [Burkholderia thailandensis]AOI51200.1 hypothetical protein WI24_04875 [Burkholderia thailandensis]AOJ46059.1 hypothetical protein WJ27_13780 [Burkholderia thailandensis]AOJ50224.1 hypothetical protein AQ475_04800 [Burkholderia thailandensis]AOJ57541.1 hypothetical protein AQ477_14260 [Burkholderia thailandensis]